MLVSHSMDFLEHILPKIGDRVHRYELVEEIGRGGFGVVFRARQEEIEADVAIKFMIPPTHTRKQSQILERFALEAKILKQLEHPATVKVRDFGRTDTKIPFIVTEYVRGQQLDVVITTSGVLCAARTQRIADQILGCLAEAHQRGVVHRDLKPANVMIRDILGGELDSVKVLDFGIARVSESQVDTQTGAFMGTPWYMSPEQTHGIKEIDGRADLYALGLMMAECVSGQRVAKPELPMAAMQVHYNNEPLPFVPAVRSSALFPVIQRATQKNPDDRYPDALAMRSHLRGLAKELDLDALGGSGEMNAPLSVADSAYEQAVADTLVEGDRARDAQAAAKTERWERRRRWRLPWVVVFVIATGLGVVLALGPWEAREVERLSVVPGSGTGTGASSELALLESDATEADRVSDSGEDVTGHSPSAPRRDIVSWVCYEGRVTQLTRAAGSQGVMLVKRVFDPHTSQIYEHWISSHGSEAYYTLTVFDGTFTVESDEASGSGQYVGEGLDWQSWSWSNRAGHDNTITLLFRKEDGVLRQTTVVSSANGHVFEESQRELFEVNCGDWETARQQMVHRPAVQDVPSVEPDQRDLIQRTVRARAAELRYCYDLRSDLTATGSLTLDFVIAPGGRVVEAEVVDSTLGAPEVESCVQAQLRHWRFPLDNTETVNVRYPISLSLDEAAE